MIKKLMTLLVAVLMVLTMANRVMAEDDETTEPAITITNAANGETYTAYLLLKATYEGELGSDSAVAYYYEGTANDPLYALLTGAGLQFGDFVEGKAYVKFENNGTAITYTETQMKNLASSIHEAMHASSNPLTLTPAGTSDPASGGTATIPVTQKGLYFVDTTLGSICSIDTAGNAQIHEKNSIPSLTKKVEEDSSGTYDKTATADIGQVVNFTLTINTGTNTYGTGNGVNTVYELEDVLPAGFTMSEEQLAAITVTFDGTPGVINQDWKLLSYTNNTLKFNFQPDKVASLGQNKNIVVSYSATMTNKAEIGYPANEGEKKNRNIATLTYHEQSSSDYAEVYTFEFVIKKIDAKTEKPLKGVKFVVTKKEDNTTYYYDGTSVWTTTETLLETDAHGLITVTGVDADTYTITEKETIDGYNLLDSDVTVTVSEKGVVASENLSGDYIVIENNTGALLPSTGGIGTTIFHVAGALLVLGAGIVLISKKRANNN